MAVPLSIKKRLKSLEYNLNGRNIVKVFIYHPEEDIPYWTPEPPDTWQNANPKGQAVILQVRNCGIE